MSRTLFAAKSLSDGKSFFFFGGGGGGQSSVSNIFQLFYPLRLFLTALAVRISLPSIFSVLTRLLIQVFTRSATIHRFVAVILQIFIIFVRQEWVKSTPVFINLAPRARVPLSRTYISRTSFTRAKKSALYCICNLL